MYCKKHTIDFEKFGSRELPIVEKRDIMFGTPVVAEAAEVLEERVHCYQSVALALNRDFEFSKACTVADLNLNLELSVA